MAVFKVCNAKTTGRASLRNVIKYVLNENKTKSDIISGIGDFDCTDSTLNVKRVYDNFIRIKELFGKDDGRQYVHAIQAFAPGESTPEEVHELGRQLASQLWKDHQVLLITHIDKAHYHNHFIVNTVSYTDGKKIHWKKQDLAKAKTINDAICIQNNLSIPQKKEIKQNNEGFEIPCWNKNLFNVIKLTMTGEKKSFVLECAKALIEAANKACSKEEFIDFMAKEGWNTTWTDTRKYLTFSDDDGHRIRNVKLAKVLEQDTSKESLLKRFQANKIKQCHKRRRKQRL